MAANANGMRRLQCRRCLYMSRSFRFIPYARRRPATLLRSAAARRELQTVVVQRRPARFSTEAMAIALRDGDVPVIARIRDDAICFDLRTLREDEFGTLEESLSAAILGEDQDHSADDAPSSAS